MEPMMELMASIGSVIMTLVFLACAVYLFGVIPYLGVRDLRKNFPHSHEHGLGIAKFLALCIALIYIILYGLCLLSTSPYVDANYGMSLIGTPPMDTTWGAAFWFVAILFIVFGSVLSIITLFLYTIAHTKKKCGEEGNKWTLLGTYIIVGFTTTWVLLTEGYALFHDAQAMNAGATLDLFKMYRMYVFSFNSVTPIMALFLSWVAVAVFLNFGRKEEVVV